MDKTSAVKTSSQCKICVTTLQQIKPGESLASFFGPNNFWLWGCSSFNWKSCFFCLQCEHWFYNLICGAGFGGYSNFFAPCNRFARISHKEFFVLSISWEASSPYGLKWGRAFTQAKASLHQAAPSAGWWKLCLSLCSTVSSQAANCSLRTPGKPGHDSHCLC